MAMVDFENARIQPSSLSGWSNPTRLYNVSLELMNMLGHFKDSSGNNVSNGSASKILDEQKKQVWIYQGTFTASGTEFYLRSEGFGAKSGWKVSNISFSNGDTYNFKIRADLICQ